MADRIRILGIRATGHHGVLEAERRDGQEFVVDVELEVDVTAAAAADDLSHTVNYAEVAQLAHDHITATACAVHDLIETLASHIADDVMRYTLVKAATVSVHKPHAPIPVPFHDVIVSVRRER